MATGRPVWTEVTKAALEGKNVQVLAVSGRWEELAPDVVQSGQSTVVHEYHGLRLGLSTPAA